MAEPDVLSTRKTFIVLVIVAGCFAVIWPRIITPLFADNVKEQIRPNKLDKATDMKQERPPHLHTSAPHPAMRERGRTIMPGAAASARPSPPSAGPVPLRREGRPVPVPGMRPPMGGAGHVVPAPKSSSVGFIMPVYTIAMVIFFFYTLCRLVFKKTGPNSEGPYSAVEPDPTFRRRVFEDSTNRNSPETNRLGDEELDMLKARLAETERAMERIVQQLKVPLAAQETQSDSTHLHKNGSVNKIEREPTPEKNIAQEFISQYQESPVVEERHSSPLPWDTHKKEYSPLPKEDSPQPKDDPIQTREYSSQPREESPKPREESTPQPREQTPEKQEVEEKGILDEKVKEQRVESEEEYSDEEISYEEDDLPSENEAPLKPIRTSAEPDNKTLTVVGMELTAHCEGGRPWGAHPATPPAPSPRPRTPAPEVSSIFLEGSLPHQSRLLVADSETHTQKQNGDGKDSPVILSGKMTLSVINDEGKESPQRVTEESETEMEADENYTSAVADTATPQQHNEKEELNDDWLEEVIEEESEEDQDVVIVPLPQDEIFVPPTRQEVLVPQQDEEVGEKIEARNHQEVTTQAEQTEDVIVNLTQSEKEVVLPLPEEVEEKILQEVPNDIEKDEYLEEDEDDEQQEYEEQDQDEIEEEEIEIQHGIEEKHILLEEEQKDVKEEISEEEVEKEMDEEVEEDVEEDETEEPEAVKYHHVAEQREEIAKELEDAKKPQQVLKKWNEQVQEFELAGKHQVQKKQEELEPELDEEEFEEEVEEEEIEVSESESEEDVEVKQKVVTESHKVNGTK